MDAMMTALFARPPGAELGLDDFLLRMLVSAIAGQAIGWFYGWSYGSLSYNQGFAQSNVLLSTVVCLIMCVVGDSVARAFGLGAALAIVRFRTPVKDARDAVFLFLAVAAGMASGVGMTGIALVGTAFVGGASVFLGWTAFGSRFGEEGVLRLQFLGDDSGRAALAEVLGRYCRSFQLSAARVAHPEAPEELVYDVNLRRMEDADLLARELIGTAGVSAVSLLPRARAGEGG